MNPSLTAAQVREIHARLGLRWREVDTFAARWLLFSPLIRVGLGRGKPRDGGLTKADAESWTHIPVRCLAPASTAAPARPKREPGTVRMASRAFDEDLIAIIEMAYPGCSWRVTRTDFGDGRVADVMAYAFAHGTPVGVLAALRSGL